MAHILVIDDNEDLRGVVRRTLEKAGHAVIELGDARQAIHVLGLGRCDLVITDVFMPLQDGIVTARLVREQYPNVKLIVMSGGAFGGSLDLLREASLLAYARALPKPFAMKELLSVVDEALAETAPEP